MKLKEALKKIIPVPIRSFNNSIDRLIRIQNKNKKNICDEIDKLHTEINKYSNGINEINDLMDSCKKDYSANKGVLERQVTVLQDLKRDNDIIINEIDRLKDNIQINKELLTSEKLKVYSKERNSIILDEIDLMINKYGQGRVVELKYIKEKVKDIFGKNEYKDIVFFSTPFWDVYTPFSAVPCLVAELNKFDYKTHQIDLGIMCFHILFEQLWKEKRKWYLSKGYYEQYFSLYKEYDITYEEYLEEVNFLTNDELTLEYIKNNYDSYNKVQKGIINAIYEAVMGAVKVNPDLKEGLNINEELEDIDMKFLLTAALEFKQIDYIINAPKVVGISVTSGGQFLYACYLAKVIKLFNPQTKVFMGGSCSDIYFREVTDSKQIFEYFDYACIGEGETAVRMLMEYLYKGYHNLEEIPGLVWLGDNGEIIKNESRLEEVNDLEPPCYDGLDLSLYMAPKLMLAYQTSRGCFYGNCAFCAHDEKYRHHYRSKDISKVLNDIKYLYTKYQNETLQFVDEAIEPKYFIEMVENMDKDTSSIFKRITWIYYSRVSGFYNEEICKKAYRNGCRMVMFGIESFNQRLLKHIKKGITVKSSVMNLKVFYESGIKTFAWLLCGLPSETEEEMYKEIEDIDENAKYISCMSGGLFRLEKSTDMYNEPEKYNILNIDEENCYNFKSHNDGVVIDKDRIDNIYKTEYTNIIRKHRHSDSRYVEFFG